MPINNDPRLIKNEARARILAAMPTVTLVSLIWFVIKSVVWLLGLELSGANRIFAEVYALVGDTLTLAQYTELVQSNIIYELIVRNTSTVGTLLTYALIICSSIIEAGFAWYSLRISRGEKPDYKSLFDGFMRFKRVLWLSVLRGVLVLIGFYLFVIPGIFVWLLFSLAIRLCYDNPSRTAVECLRRSARLMHTRKLAMAWLMMTFIGWFFVGFFVSLFALLPLTDIFMNIYIAVSISVFYNNVLLSLNPTPPEAQSEPTNAEPPSSK